MHNFIKYNFMFYKRRHIVALTQGKSLILNDSVHPAVRIMKNKPKLKSYFLLTGPLLKCL